MNIYFKYSSLSRIYNVPENGFVEITYMDEGAVYDIYNEDGLQVNTFTVSYRERVETVFDAENPDEIECLSVPPVYSEEDETLETILEILQILTIPVVFLRQHDRMRLPVLPEEAEKANRAFSGSLPEGGGE